MAHTKRGKSANPRVILLPIPQKKRSKKIEAEPLHRPKNVKPETLADHLAAQGGEGTDLERIIRNAAKMLNFHFDAEQWVVHLVVNGSYTRIDFVTFDPKRAVYPQGWQHYERLDSFQKDTLQDAELRDNGWMVFRPSFKEIYADPLQVMRMIIMGVEQYTRQDP